ncbi:DUF721 domain-containing protein [Odoribacter sp. OttesenSCG-928-J03]|nr:DUF721 domain-containing protein [Odoribacter sp. OttesenSCG-928-J03]MDL2283138.1 DUF721 domain-containing protein [Odoribacter sp. OttesenSCG-928-G04]MDL2330494.1 DUF721 domain-containing protein [Odoribacter sp. OttesenSCG-928-A06]
MHQGKALKLDQLVDLILKQYGIDKRLKECEVPLVWEEVVGKMIASRTKSIRMQNGKLYVSFTSSVVKNEMLLVKEGLIAALNDKVGEGVVKEIIIY